MYYFCTSSDIYLKLLSDYHTVKSTEFTSKGLEDYLPGISELFLY